MSHSRRTTVTAALAGAVSLASAGTALAESDATTAGLAGYVKCYGISMAGQNSCANPAGTHDCAGEAASDYSGQEWRAVKKDSCVRLGGQLAPFEGVGHPHRG
jgi:uncharacterized membrane protein